MYENARAKYRSTFAEIQSQNLKQFVDDTHHPSNNMFEVFDIHKNILHKRETMNKFVDRSNVMNCKRQSKICREIRVLSSSRFEASQSISTVSKCRLSRCAHASLF